jgi:uncharacterized protein (TIGR02300 family)
MSKAEWGTKRRCAKCEAPFYDMLRDPIRCPSCDAVFKVEAPRMRPTAKRAAKPPTIDRPPPAAARIAAKASELGNDEEDAAREREDGDGEDDLFDEADGDDGEPNVEEEEAAAGEP